MCIKTLFLYPNACWISVKFTSSVCVVCLQLNELRTHIIDTNHRLMAVSAELSMKQAAALCLQHEIKERELQVRVGPSWTHSTHHNLILESKNSDCGFILPSVSRCLNHYSCHSPLTAIEKRAKSASQIISYCDPSFTSDTCIQLICTIKQMRKK